MSSTQHNTTQVIKINQRIALIANLKLCHYGKKARENVKKYVNLRL